MSLVTQKIITVSFMHKIDHSELIKQLKAEGGSTEVLETLQSKEPSRESATLFITGCGFASTLLITAFGGENQYIASRTGGHMANMSITKVCADSPIETMTANGTRGTESQQSNNVTYKIRHADDEIISDAESSSFEVAESLLTETFLKWLPEELRRNTDVLQFFYKT